MDICLRLKNVTGVDLSYDMPKNCDLIADSSKQDDLNKRVEEILKW